MELASGRLGNFECDYCANMGFGFKHQPTARRLYKFPCTIGADGPAPLLFVGLNPRMSESNRALHDLVTSDLNVFDRLSRNRECGEAYIAPHGKERHYRIHARIAKAARPGGDIDDPPFESIAACTEVFLCATEGTTPAIAAYLQNGSGPCVERHLWKTLARVQPKVVIAVGTLVYNFLARSCTGSPPRLNVGDRPALLAIPHPSRQRLSLESCEEVGKVCRAIISSEENRGAISYEWDHRFAPRTRTTMIGNLIQTDVEWSSKYGWKPHHRVADLKWLDEDPSRKIRYALMKDQMCRYHVEVDARQLRGAIGSYVDGPRWQKTGYTNSITISVGGRPTEQLKPAWSAFARKVAP